MVAPAGVVFPRVWLWLLVLMWGGVHHLLALLLWGLLLLARATTVVACWLPATTQVARRGSTWRCCARALVVAALAPATPVSRLSCPPRLVLLVLLHDAVISCLSDIL